VGNIGQAGETTRAISPAAWRGRAASVDFIGPNQKGKRDRLSAYRQTSIKLVATSGALLRDDSPIRIVSINRHGSITLSKKKRHPIWDWTKREVVDCINKA
jgi:hypothetical protein